MNDDTAAGPQWQRLSARNLLLDPVKALGQLLVPGVIALVGISSSRDEGMPLWAVPLIALGAVAFGALPWLTTRWRITDTQLQKRTGLLNRTTSTAPLDRVRSVDLEATLLHRVLGLQKVQVGTGVDEDRITLDSVSRERAAELRRTLLARRQPVAPGPAEVEAPEVAPAEPVTELAAIDWAWVRFAPFSLARLVVFAGAAGLLAQFGDNLPLLDREHLTAGWAWLVQLALWLVVGAVLVSGLTSWVVVAVVGYVVQWWDMRLTRDHGSLHLTAGLFTTRSITVEEKRVRGVELREPLLLRAVGGGELSTLATGVEDGVTSILPPCPRQVCVDVGGDVLGRDDLLTRPLTQHGRAARRRAWFAHVWDAPVSAALAVVVLVATDVDWLGWWLPVVVFAVEVVVGGVLAEASYRHLGHALTDTHLVAGSGMLTRTRTVLENDGIIGWVVSESLFQRRVGLADLVATTAAGAEKVVVHDVPRTTAVALAVAATPGVLDEFLVDA